MSMKPSNQTDSERILCVSRADLPPRWLATELSLPLDMGSFERCVAGLPFFFDFRSSLERAPSFKQLIPYVLVQINHGKQTACYRRKGSEARLHDLWSVGIGGHVSIADRHNPSEGLESILYRGLRRELSEEFQSWPSDAEPLFQGVINEELTEVGSVHLGLVYRLEVDEASALVPGKELCDFRWLATADLARLPMELWSRLALRLVQADTSGQTSTDR